MTDGLSVRVFISYAHDSDAHVDAVRDLWLLLRANGIDAVLDLPAAERRQDWPLWMLAEMRAARYVLVIASPAYRRRAEGDAAPDEGRGVQYEAALVREEAYADRAASLDRFLPVVLPGGSADDIPRFLGPTTTTHYVVSSLSVDGATPLLRVLTGQPYETTPALGPTPTLPARSASPGPQVAVLVDVGVEAGAVVSRVTIASTRLGEVRSRVPDEVSRIWNVPDADVIAAEARLVQVGQRVSTLLFDERTGHAVADLVAGLRAGQVIDVSLVGDDAALLLPIELARLKTHDGVDLGPLGLCAGVAVHRQIRGVTVPSLPPPPGPLKILAAVAAPLAGVGGPPLDVEAEMGAILDCVASVDGTDGAGVRILEVASLAQIVAAFREDTFHVLHLSAHGSRDSIELEDEDGQATTVHAQTLLDALRDVGREVPLVVLSSCSGAAGGPSGLAAELVRCGARHVLAMQAPVSDAYATALARALYEELLAHPTDAVGIALGRARRRVEAARSAAGAGRARPEYGVPTLFVAGVDMPLLDPNATPLPLARRTLVPSGNSVRELPVGRLVGRRDQFRAAAATLLRNARSVAEHGAISGVVLTGPGGIGKTALAGRLVTRLREEGYRCAIHEGLWNPTALIDAVRMAVADDATLATALRPGLDDTMQLAAVHDLLRKTRLVVVLDDFEQNLTDGGGAFLDPTVDEVLTSFAEAARTGTILVTCRFPLPGPDRYLVTVPVPALSPAELRRLLLRMPALRDLPDDDRRAIVRTIGGHPRLIEFLDALVRHGRPELHDTARKFTTLARDAGVDLTRPRTLTESLDDTVLLGSADILTAALLDLLTPTEHEALSYLAVTRAPLSLDDLGYALDDVEPDVPRRIELASATRRLVDLTLLANDDRGMLLMPAWTAETLTRTLATDLARQHERGFEMRWRRLNSPPATVDDLLDAGRHLAALGHYNDLARLATVTVPLLPGALAAGAYLAETRPLIPTTERAYILVADLEARTLVTAGNLPTARRTTLDLHEMIIQRATTDPANTQWQRDLAISHQRLGDLDRAAGDTAAARDHYRATLDITERLAATDPTNTEWQRGLAISYNHLGDLDRATGDTAAARDRYQAALGITEHLAATDPTNTQWQRDLAISHQRLGDLDRATGDTAAARDRYRTYLGITERLAATDPTNTEWQRDLAISHQRLGDLDRATGDTAAARDHYRAQLDFTERLAATDPTNTESQRGLAISHSHLGDLDRATGDTAAARDHYQAALGITERLAATDPTNTQWQRDLAISHNRLGDLDRATGDTAAARDHYQAALDITEHLAATDPTNTEWQRGLAISHERLGDLDRATGDTAAARDHYQTTLVIIERIPADEPALQDAIEALLKRLADLDSTEATAELLDDHEGQVRLRDAEREVKAGRGVDADALRDAMERRHPRRE